MKRRDFNKLALATPLLGLTNLEAKERSHKISSTNEIYYKKKPIRNLEAKEKQYSSKLSKIHLFPGETETFELKGEKCLVASYTSQLEIWVRDFEIDNPEVPHIEIFDDTYEMKSNLSFKIHGEFKEVMFRDIDIKPNPFGLKPKNPYELLDNPFTCKIYCNPDSDEVYVEDFKERFGIGLHSYKEILEEYYARRYVTNKYKLDIKRFEHKTLTYYFKNLEEVYLAIDFFRNSAEVDGGWLAFCTDNVEPEFKEEWIAVVCHNPKFGKDGKKIANDILLPVSTSTKERKEGWKLKEINQINEPTLFNSVATDPILKHRML